MSVLFMKISVRCLEILPITQALYFEFFNRRFYLIWMDLRSLGGTPTIVREMSPLQRKTTTPQPFRLLKRRDLNYGGLNFTFIIFDSGACRGK